MAINPGDRAMGGFGNGNIGGGSSISSAGGGIRDGGMRTNGGGQASNFGGGGGGNSGNGGMRSAGMMAGSAGRDGGGGVGGQPFGAARGTNMGMQLGPSFSNSFLGASTSFPTSVNGTSVAQAMGKYLGMSPASIMSSALLGKPRATNPGVMGAEAYYSSMPTVSPSTGRLNSTPVSVGGYITPAATNLEKMRFRGAGAFPGTDVNMFGERLATDRAMMSPAAPSPPTAVASGTPQNLLSPNYFNPYDVFSDPSVFPQVTPAAGSFPPTGFGPFNPQSGYVPKMEGVPISAPAPSRPMGFGPFNPQSGYVPRMEGVPINTQTPSTSPNGFGPFNPQSGYVPQMGGVPIDMVQPGFADPEPSPDFAASPMVQPGFAVQPPRSRPNFNADGQAVYGLGETLMGLFNGNPVPPNPQRPNTGFGGDRGERGFGNRDGGRDKTKYKNNFTAAPAVNPYELYMYGLIPGQNSLI